LKDLTGLTLVEPTTFVYGAQSDNFYVYAGPPSSGPGVLSPTFSDTAGDQLKVLGWAIGDKTQGLGEISYFFDGLLLGSPICPAETGLSRRFK
jgi:hypothetical protein